MATGDNMDAPVFVAGMARSGTTLFGTIIGAHPRLSIAPESHFLDRGVDPHLSSNLDDVEDLKTLWRDYAKTDRFQALGIEAQAIDSALEAGRIASVGDLYRALLKGYASSLGHEGWGDKTHIDYRYFEWILEWFPHARIVCVVRDPRATVASLLKAPWSSGSAYYYALQWRETMLIVAAFRDHERVCVVRYEDLVESLDRVVGDICTFLQVSFHPAMLDRDDDPAPIAEDATWDLAEWWREHKDRAMAPVTTASLDRWRDELTPLQVAMIEHVNRGAMADFAYTPNSPRLSVSQSIQLRLTQVARLGRAALRPDRLWKRAQSPRSISSPRPW